MNRRPGWHGLRMPHGLVWSVLVLSITLGTTLPLRQGTPLRVAEGSSSGRVSGALIQWQPVTVDFAGPVARETDTAPHPFLDYRLQVTFTGPAGRTYTVPGFFDGDSTGGGSGTVWRARFTPDQAGTWTDQASFRRGPNVAIDLSPTAGTPTSFDGAAGTVAVADRDPGAPGVLKWGRLEYAGGHYLKVRDGPSWLKGGADSPANLLGYTGLDNTPTARHSFAAHVQDGRSDDPLLNTTSPDGGKGLIGASNYLAVRGVNSVYFLPMNIGGDGQDTWPFVGPISRAGSSANDNGQRPHGRTGNPVARRGCKATGLGHAR